MEQNNNHKEFNIVPTQNKKYGKYISIKQIIDDTLPSPDPIIGDGILLEQTLLLIKGKQKAWKSMFAMNLSIALAKGESFSIFKIKRKQRVLLLSSEGGYYPNRDRINKMAKRFPEAAELDLFMCFDPRLKIDQNDGQEQIRKKLSLFVPSVLIIDPLIKFHNSDENSAKEMIKVMNELRNLIEDYKLSIILVHHMGKNGSSGSRGSSVIEGEYDSCIEMSITDKKKKEVSLEFDLRHFESPDKKKIVFDANTFWFESEISELSKTAKLVQEFGPITRKLLANKLVESGSYSSIPNAYKPIKTDIDKGILVIDKDEQITLAKL